MPCITPSLLSWNWQRVKIRTKWRFPGWYPTSPGILREGWEPGRIISTSDQALPRFYLSFPRTRRFTIIGRLSVLEIDFGLDGIRYFSACSQPAIVLLGGNHDSPLGVEVGSWADSFGWTRPEMDSRTKLGQIVANFQPNVCCDGALQIPSLY